MVSNKQLKYIWSSEAWTLTFLIVFLSNFDTVISECKAETTVCGNWWMKRFVYSTITAFSNTLQCAQCDQKEGGGEFTKGGHFKCTRQEVQIGHREMSTHIQQWVSNTVTSQRDWVWLQPTGWKDKSGRTPMLLLAWLLRPYLSTLVQAYRHIALKVQATEIMWPWTSLILG